MSALDWIVVVALFVLSVAVLLRVEKANDRRYVAWFKNLNAVEKDDYLAWLRLHAPVMRRSPAGLRAIYLRERAVTSRVGDVEGEEK